MAGRVLGKADKPPDKNISVCLCLYPCFYNHAFVSSFQGGWIKLASENLWEMPGNSEGHFTRIQHNLDKKKALLKIRYQAVRLVAPQASPKACIKHVCVSVVWTFRQLPRCHHTGQRWPIPQEEGGDQGHGWPEEGSAHCKWIFLFILLLNTSECWFYICMRPVQFTSCSEILIQMTIFPF